MNARRTGRFPPALRIPDEHVTAALGHLRQRDRTMRRIIDAHGPFALELKTDAFPVLVQSIISQQISTAAAASIRRRLDELRGRRKLTAGWVLDQSDEQLRGVGLSPQKLRYLRDLAGKVDNKTLNLKALPSSSDEEVIAALTQVLGIGVWTAQMYLIFSLGRLDVLPTGDLGIRAAIQREYALEEHPTPKQCEQLAAPWRPYASIASWYLWRSSDAKLTPEQQEMWK